MIIQIFNHGCSRSDTNFFIDIFCFDNGSFSAVGPPGKISTSAFDYSFSAARSRVLLAMGLAATSAAVGRTTFLVNRRTRGF